MLERYREQKEQVRSTLSGIATLAGELGMRSLQSDIEGVRLPKLAEERFNLVVLGEFNHGKTTFVNALLGEALLPVGITPTTATINHIVHGDEPRARAIKRDGSVEELSPADIADYVTLEGERSEGIRFVELRYPAELLRDKVTLVDTPGVNDINEARAEITYSYIPRADAVIFLLDSTQVLKQSERAFITQRLMRRNRDKLIFVLGKADLLDAEELAQARAFAEEHLAELVEDPVLFTLSARRYLAGQHDESGLPPFMDFLRRYLDEQRGRVLIDNAVGDGLRTVSYLQSSLGIRRASQDLSLEQLSQRIEEVKARLNGSQQNLRDTLQRLRNETAAVKATVRHDLRQFRDAFCEALPGEIDKADAADVKRYLTFFIQDKFKEWAEEEGDKVASLLQDLAEEIIQVMSENVEEVLDAVAARFGPSDARVELDVDTLRYDVGVFALGALGTTIFLFVNTFVGGLLTLAAPILAVVLREKIGAQIKKQAREKGPEAVRRAADTIAPRFEEIVDQFEERLEGFITDAGEALHRGIGEVLDKALAERSETEADAEVIKEELVEKEARLGELAGELTALRASLWVEEEEPAAREEVEAGGGEE